MDLERVWYLGRTVRRNIPAVAAVVLPVRDIEAVGLCCEPAPIPEDGFPEHGVILGWNQESKDERKARQQDLIARLFADSIIRPR